MKKIVSFLVIAVMAAGLLAGCGKSTEETYPAHIEGSIFGGAAGANIGLDIKFDPKWMTKGDNTKYNKDLAAFAAIICADTYFRTKDLDKGTQNRVLLDANDAADYDWTLLMKSIGFTDVKYVESFKAKEYAADGNDSATLTMGYRDDDKNDIFVIALRGSFSIQEWFSVFDPGCDSAEYTAWTGEHAEWTNKNYMKGMDVAANRSMEFIDEFIAANDDPSKQNCILITGHSRGAELANIIGAKMEKESDAKAFTYTFNTMGVTTDKGATEYKTIFNISDIHDFYSNPLPFAKEDFYRYGKDMTLDIAENNEVKEALAALKGRDDYTSMSLEALDEYKALFGQRFEDRASLYTSQSESFAFDTKEQAQESFEELENLIGSENGLGLEAWCKLGEVTDKDGKYEVAVEYCGGSLLAGFAKVLAYGSAAHDAFVNLFSGDELACQIVDFFMENAAGISGGHVLANGYVISGYVK